MKATLYAALLTVTCPLAALAQTADEIRNADKTPQHVLTYGMSYNHQRHSPLSQINRDTVKRLVPAWSYSMNNNTGEESQPLVYKGIIYITSHDKTVAINALTGKEIWKTPVEYPPDTTRVVCCGIVNRGAAIYEGKIFRTTLDARVIALDMNTGKELWATKSGDAKDGIAMTNAPLIANGVLITGMAGAEYGSRGYIEGYDPDTGKRLWRLYTVPRPGEPGADTWPDHAANASGGSSWTTGAYDPELDLVFWGTGNPAPWNALLRKGDNLYADCVLAIRPKTGELVWHYQMSPNDPFDHDNITAIVLAEIAINGKPTKVVLQVARNGFVYLLDRAKDMLIRGGENIYCVEIEDALLSHPGIIDAAVVGIPDRVLGELVGAVVQVKAGATLTQQEVVEYLRPRLAAFKLPVRVDIRTDDMPRTASGKIVKMQLRREMAQKA